MLHYKGWDVRDGYQSKMTAFGPTQFQAIVSPPNDYEDYLVD
jgi:hypothetical protein